MENTKIETPVTGNKVKAIPTGPVYAMFDVVKHDGKDVIVGSVGFVDQFGMERLAKTAGEKGILNLGQHVLEIFFGNIEIIEPDEETKAKLAAKLTEEAQAMKARIMADPTIVSAYTKQ